MKRERYRLEGNPKRAIDALTEGLARYGCRGVHWDFSTPIFELASLYGDQAVPVCTIQYHDDQTWLCAHAALQPVIGVIKAH
jgi:hypothetical protein